ncbi:MAG: RagB/SusD family nutrient uptake outer membrane protein [Balneolales bacterium]|nr:RagB/SusD family nutrient uptake outer membrane protein [Balneolales bacterium]
MVLFAVTITACESYLDTTPTDLIDASQAFRSVSNLEAGALGVYATYAGGAGAMSHTELNALVSDELRRASTNTGQGMQLFNHNIVSGDNTALAMWTSAYYTIDRANRVLAGVDIVEANTAAEQTRQNRVQGEMLGLRAWAHFDLFRAFADFTPTGLAVPYMTQSQISSPARMEKAAFFTQLNADIDAAIALLQPFGFTPGTDQNERINFRALQALKARVALYREDWPTAIQYASAVIDNVPLTSLADFPAIWSDENNDEVLLKFRRPDVTAGTVEIFERSTNPDVFFWASNQLVDQFDRGNDVRFGVYFQEENATTFRVMKYNQRASKNLADVKLIRVAEMYLIRAEAYARSASPNLAGAAADVASLRAQRYTTPPATSFGSADAAMSTIRAERRLELAMEGHRLYDAKRYGSTLTRIPADIDGSTAEVTASLDPASERGYLFVMPIPQTEIFANPNMQQNPGYN